MSCKIETLNQVNGLTVGQILFQDEIERFIIKKIKRDYFILENQQDNFRVKIILRYNLLNDGWHSEIKRP
jgi:hypothetical protein